MRQPFIHRNCGLFPYSLRLGCSSLLVCVSTLFHLTSIMLASFVLAALVAGSAVAKPCVDSRDSNLTRKARSRSTSAHRRSIRTDQIQTTNDLGGRTSRPQVREKEKHELTPPATAARRTRRRRCARLSSPTRSRTSASGARPSPTLASATTSRSSSRGATRRVDFRLEADVPRPATALASCPRERSRVFKSSTLPIVRRARAFCLTLAVVAFTGRADLTKVNINGYKVRLRLSSLTLAGWRR